MPSLISGPCSLCAAANGCLAAAPASLPSAHCAPAQRCDDDSTLASAYTHTQEWEGLPAPFKYLGVSVNPEHVTAHGPVWKFFSDWKTAIPASVLFTLPLWMFNWLPPVDERFELAMIVTAAGWVMIGAAGPMFRAWKRSRVAVKVKALLAAESDLNETIATATTAFASGAAVRGVACPGVGCAACDV